MSEPQEEKSIAEEAGEAMRRDQAALDAKFRALEEKAKIAKGVYKTTRPSEDKREQKIGSYRGLGFGLMLAYGMIGVPLVGYGLGYLVERKNGPGIGTTIGAVIAMIWVVYMVNRQNAAS